MPRPSQHKTGVLGFALISIEVIRLIWHLAIRPLLQLLSLGGDVDFALEHLQRPGWVANMTELLGAPWLQLLIIGSGLALIYFDKSRVIKPVSGASSTKTKAQLIIETKKWQYGVWALSAALILVILSFYSREQAPSRSTNASLTVVAAQLASNMDKDHFSINILTKNTGRLDANNLRFEGGYYDGPLGHPPNQQIDDLAELFLIKLKNKRSQPMANDVAPGISRVFSAFGQRSLYDANKNGSRDLYLLSTFEYADEVTGKGKWWVSEGCWRIWPNDSLPRCNFHNARPFLRE